MTTKEALPRILPLNDKHLAMNARMSDFGGWEVPVFYTSIIEEHNSVRNSVGVFDISHMGEITVEGNGAVQFLDSVCPRDINSLKQGVALYMPFVNDNGGIVDDVILYRFSENSFLFIVNASNIEKDYDWLQSKNLSGVEIKNVSDKFGLLALQGPEAKSVLGKAFGAFYLDIKRFNFRQFEGGIITRTGYTGEDGYEIMIPIEKLEDIWDILFRAGEEKKLVPVGFGARDTLRLEAAMPLYGYELTDDISPLDAGLGWAVDLEKKTFPGIDILRKQKERGIERKRIGFEMLERGIPRDGCEIQKNNKRIGFVTSGSFIPSTKKSIGMGYVSISESEIGNELDIIIRGKPARAKIVKLPFYKKE